MSTGLMLRSALALLLVAPPAHALQAGDAQEAAGERGETARTQSPEPTSGPEPKPQAAPGSSPDTVTPSERIEADSAVAFPVDI